MTMLILHKSSTDIPIIGRNTIKCRLCSMKFKSCVWIVVFLAALAIGASPAYSRMYHRSSTGFQVSTFAALNAGIFEEATTLDKLKSRGDFGLGTVEGLDGEAVAVDGEFYQVKADGVASRLTDQTKIPFSTVAFFRPERSLRLSGQLTYAELQQQIDKQLPTVNTPYAIRLRGSFPAVKVRSVPKQSPPYPLLTEALKQQKIFELQNVTGTLVGFRLPQSFKAVNIAGYHFHLLTRDHKAGGHLLEATFSDPVVEIQILRDWQIMLPSNSAFDRASLE